MGDTSSGFQKDTEQNGKIAQAIGGGGGGDDDDLEARLNSLRK